jgi:hypothetical protein
MHSNYTHILISSIIVKDRYLTIIDDTKIQNKFFLERKLHFLQAVVASTTKPPKMIKKIIS